jgi:hypothetical protein
VFYRPLRLRAGTRPPRWHGVLDFLVRLWPVSVLLVLAHTLGVVWLHRHPCTEMGLWLVQAYLMASWYYRASRPRSGKRGARNRPWHVPAHQNSDR